jgi:hypothetical protein
MPIDPTRIPRVHVGYADAVRDVKTYYPNDSGAVFNIAPEHGVPSFGTSAGKPGDIAVDGDHIYFCRSSGSWSRATLANF